MEEPRAPRTKAATSMPCPACGVAVTVGYPRCPKCGNIMPARRIKRPTFREENLAGGTTLEQPDEGSRAGWVLAAALLVLGASLAVYFASRDRVRPVEPPADVETDEPDDDEAPLSEPEPGEETPVRGTAASRRDTGENRAVDAARTIKQVDEALRVQRLWAKVRAEGGVLVIESSLCEDAAMRPTLSGVVDVLRASGFASVRCQEPNGKVDFEDAI